MTSFFRLQNIKTRLHWRGRPFWLGKGLLVLIALTLLWGSIAWNLTNERRNTERDARADASNLARAFEENLVRSLEAIDQQLLHLRYLYVHDPAGFARIATTPGTTLLRGLAVQIGIIDRTGLVQFSSLGPITSRVDLSDREHFRVHLTDSADFLYVGKPVLGRVSNIATVQVTRKILDVDGRFAGVIVFSLDPQWLSRFHATLDIGPSSVFVVGLDAVLRASAPITDDVGKDISGSRLLDATKQKNRGDFLGQTVPGGPESFVSYRTLSEFPLIVAVGLEADAVFAEFRRSARWQIGTGIALSLVVLAVGSMLIWLRAAQQRSEALAAARATELAQNAAVFNFLSEATPLAGIGLTKGRRVCAWNHSAEVIFGYSADEVLGQPYPLVPPGVEAEYEELRTRISTGENLRDIEMRRRRKDGRLIDLRFWGSINYVTPDNEDASMLMLEDVTERKTAIARLQESEARFRSAFDAAGHGMALLDRDGRFLQVNAAYCRIMGYSDAELLDRLVRDITHPDDVAKDAANRERLDAGQIPFYETEKRYIRKDGATVWAQLNTGVVRDAAGTPLHYISQVQDTTQRRQTEDRLRQAQKMEAVGQLTAGIAHDFNNILAAIVGNLDMISEQLATDPATAGQHTEEAINAAMSGAELVKRLLAFSRQQPLQTKPTDLTEAIASVVPLLRRSLGEQIEVRAEIPADLWPAMVDTAQMESALLNLAINARDAMPDGGVLSLDVSNAHVNGGLFPAHDDLKAGDYVVIAVTDSGIGMASEVLAHAFEPFFTTKAVGTGSGLGLSMVLGTMQQMGGSARIYSECGHGTTVRLFLPRADHVGDPPAVAGAEAAQPVGQERVLVVEDDEQIRNNVEMMIRRLGYTVTVVDNATEALVLWDRGERFDLVFTDIILPGRHNGVGLARALRARDPRIKILLTSGFANPVVVLGDVAELGFEVLPKPYRKEALAARLRAVLDQKTP